VILTGTKRNDVTQLQALVEAILPIAARVQTTIEASGHLGRTTTNIDVHRTQPSLQPKSLGAINLTKRPTQKAPRPAANHLMA
jgi:hypothetical protein